MAMPGQRSPYLYPPLLIFFALGRGGKYFQDDIYFINEIFAGVSATRQKNTRFCEKSLSLRL